MVFWVYAWRSLLARARANAITLLTVALFVAAGTLGLTFYLGLKQMSVNAAPPENIGVISKGASAEIDSAFDLDTVNRLVVRDGIRKHDGVPLAVREVITEIHVDTLEYGTYPRPVTLRGIEAASPRAHQATIVAGAAPAPNSLELLVGRRAAERYPKLKVGAVFHLPAGDCKVAGIFTARGGPFEDEIWTPRSAFDLHSKTNRINSVTLVADTASRVPDIVAQINASKDLQATAASYAKWWEQRSRLKAVAWTVLLLLALLSAVAAIAISATMNAAVVVRIPELAALAAIGVRKSLLARVVVLESALLGTLGGALGVLASFVIGSQVRSVPFTQSTVAITPTVVLGLLGILLGIVVALLGGLAPAVRVRRLDVLRAMR